MATSSDSQRGAVKAIIMVIKFAHITPVLPQRGSVQFKIGGANWGHRVCLYRCNILHAPAIAMGLKIKTSHLRLITEIHVKKLYIHK